MDHYAHSTTKNANNTNDGVLAINTYGEIVFANPATKKMFGYSSYELMGCNLKTIIPTSFHFKGIQDYFSKNEYEKEMFGLHKNGSTFYLELNLCEFNFLGKELFIVVIRDLTVRKTFEKGLIEAKQAAENANRAKTEFLSNISHDLRTPLHIIKNLAYLAKIKAKRLTELTSINSLATSSEIKEDLDKITLFLEGIQESQAKQLSLINDLLDLAKLESGLVDLNKENFDLISAINKELDSVKLLIKEKKLHLHFESKEQHLQITADKIKILRVIQNILSNAIKFSNQGGLIKIIISKDKNNSFRIIIRDQGCGIPETELKNIFNKFTQSHNNNQKTGGTGLGLAICKEIILAHNGNITCKNNSKVGASFEITLPICNEKENTK